MERARRSNTPIFVFNTFFYPKLKEQGYEGVRRWTRRVDLFSFEKIILPIHLTNHWCLAAVNLRERRFEYYDSLHGNGKNVISVRLSPAASVEFKNERC